LPPHIAQRLKAEQEKEAEVAALAKTAWNAEQPARAMTEQARKVAAEADAYRRFGAGA